MLKYKALATAAALLIAGCTSEPTPGPITHPEPVHPAIDPALVGVTRGNPTCAVPMISPAQWRQATEVRLASGLPLVAGATVWAKKLADGRWELRITPPGGRQSTHQVAEEIALRSFDGSCARRLYRLTKSIKGHSGPVGPNSQTIAEGAELVVTKTRIVTGVPVYVVAARDGATYWVIAAELEESSTPSDDVPTGRWRDAPDALFFRLQQPVRTTGGTQLETGTLIKVEATISCGATPGEDVVAFNLFPDAVLGDQALASRFELLAALEHDRVKTADAKHWLSGKAERVHCRKN